MLHYELALAMLQLIEKLCLENLLGTVTERCVVLHIVIKTEDTPFVLKLLHSH